jgi:triosephosphate isomerase (TIM)
MSTTTPASQSPIQIRRKLIAGNWKMNKTAADGVALAREIVEQVGRETQVDVVLCPPFTALESVGHALEGQAIKLGAQNMHPEKNGAFTGEVSAEMLRTLYVTHVILGHSERRQYFGETDDFINRKVLAALAHQLRPILCVGESLAEREAGSTLDVVQRQLEGALAGVKPDQITTVIVAYEPVWAIGTGKVATTAQAQEVHAFIRDLLGRLFAPALAQKVRILYGGSMKPANAPELLTQPDIDGGLIGGASLESRSFVELVRAALAAN